MKISEMINLREEDAHDEQIAAIGQLIADRTEDEDSPSKLSTQAFVNIANKMGLSLSQETLMDLAQSGKLASVISDVSDAEIHFRGQKDIDPETMSVDKANDVVAQMSKRSAKKGVYDTNPNYDNDFKDDDSLG